MVLTAGDPPRGVTVANHPGTIEGHVSPLPINWRNHPQTLGKFDAIIDLNSSISKFRKSVEQNIA